MRGSAKVDYRSNAAVGVTDLVARLKCTYIQPLDSRGEIHAYAAHSFENRHVKLCGETNLKVNFRRVTLGRNLWLVRDSLSHARKNACAGKGRTATPEASRTLRETPG